MSDTKRMEMVAENLIAHFLQRHNILVAKPLFDQEGGDLIAMTTDGEIRFCRIQCKGRTLLTGEGSSLALSAALELKSLVVCLFIDDGSFDGLNLFAFFDEDILQWAKNPAGDKYVLSLHNSTFAENLKPFKVSGHTIDRISNTIMDASIPLTKRYRFTGAGELGLAGASPSVIK